MISTTDSLCHRWTEWAQQRPTLAHLQNERKYFLKICSYFECKLVIALNPILIQLICYLFKTFQLLRYKRKVIFRRKKIKFLKSYLRFSIRLKWVCRQFFNLCLYSIFKLNRHFDAIYKYLANSFCETLFAIIFFLRIGFSISERELLPKLRIKSSK